MTVSNRSAGLPRKVQPAGSAKPLPRRIGGALRLAAMTLDFGLSVGAALLLADACAAGSACAVAQDEGAQAGVLAGLLFMGFALGSHGYSRAVLLRPAFPLLVGAWVKTLLLLAVFRALVGPGVEAMASLALYGFLGLMAVLAGRELLAMALSLAYGSGALSRFRTLALARTRPEAEALARALAAEADCEPVAALSARSLDGVADRLQQGDVDRIVVKTGGLAREDLADLLERVRCHAPSVHFLAGAPRLTGFQRPADEMGALPVFAVKRAPLSSGERLAKRIFDVSVASLALFALAPVLLAVALGLRARGRPALRRVRCTGFDGRSFGLLSFADSSADPEGGSGLLARSGLRALPALLNVLAGDLSLVGPRAHGPHPCEADRMVARFAALQGLKPGLVHGFMVEGPLSGPVHEADRRRLHGDELAYLEQWSLMLDLAVLAGGLGRNCIVREERTA